MAKVTITIKDADKMMEEHLTHIVSCAQVIEDMTGLSVEVINVKTKE